MCWFWFDVEDEGVASSTNLFVVRTENAVVLVNRLDDAGAEVFFVK
jgi:hypothetical protein